MAAPPFPGSLLKKGEGSTVGAAEPTYLVIPLLLAGITYHFDVGDLQMSVLTIVFLDAGIVGHIFGVFLHVMRGRIRDNARCRNRMSHVLGQRDVAAAYFPGAAVLTGEPELVGAVTL